MPLKPPIGLLAILALLAFLASMVPPSASAAPPPPTPSLELTHPVVSQPIAPASTAGLPPAPTIRQSTGPVEEVFNLPDPFLSREAADTNDPLVQVEAGAQAAIPTLLNFEGLRNLDRLTPPDPDGQVGPNHYVQMVNVSTAVYDKRGQLLYGPFHPSALWPAGDPCSLQNDGDPIVLYDQMADRWLISQFGLPNGMVMGPFYECIAVSRGPNPTSHPGDWYPYTFQVHANKMNDYPKLGVWPDGYYMSANQFLNNQAAGVGIWAFDRERMLRGEPAAFQYFDLEGMNPSLWGLLPSNLMGSSLPPPGSPNYFAGVDQDWAGTQDVFHLFEFHVDWNNPLNSSFRLVKDLPVAPYDAVFDAVRRNIPQPGTSNRLDAIPGRLMMHLWYRNFGDHASLVTNHTVDASASDHAGIRWYEVRDPGPGAYVFQQGTYAPDSYHRWMGSLAMDRAGNMALGYSIAGSTLHPGIRFTGREVGDPLGVMTLAETTIAHGGAAQTISNRWGDYSAMSVDPLDDCTFWYTQMYIGAGSPDWRTRIAAFRFPSCNAASGGLQGVVTGPGGEPLGGVELTLTGAQARTTISGPDGSYGFSGLPVGEYSLQAELYGYLDEVVSGVAILAGEAVRLDLVLDPAPRASVAGTVRDAQTGWPLYARVQVRDHPVSAAFTDPLTGVFQLNLVSGQPYTLDVSAELDGYQPGATSLPPLADGQSININLTADTAACTAPGYAVQATLMDEDFETGEGGFTHYGYGDQWAWGTPQGWPGGCASGERCWGTNLSGPYGSSSQQILVSPPVDLSGVPAGTPLAVHWSQAWAIESALYDTAAMEMSIDGGEWIPLWEHRGATTETGWTPLHGDLSAAAGKTVHLRWRLDSDVAVEYAGLYVDDVRITSGCQAQPGGLVVGQVRSQEGLALPGSVVRGENGETAVAQTTPDDLEIDEGFYALHSPAGSHTLTARGSYGYGEESASVEVVTGQAVPQDFFLTASESLVIEGQVRDAATGWPLYARVEIEGYPGGDVWTDPVTGGYSVELAQDHPYRLRVSAWLPGYISQERSIPALEASRTEDFQLAADIESCLAPGYSRTGGLVENFSGGTLPSGWKVVNPPGQNGWVFNDPRGRGNRTGGSGSFAIADSDALGRVDIDSELRSPVVDFSTAARVLLSFQSDYYHYSEDLAQVDVSVNGESGPWLTVWERSTDARGPRLETVDLTGQAAGHGQVMVRFRYQANYDWWWQVDEVVLGENPGCQPPVDGGLVAGSVFDSNTGLAVPGAQVQAGSGEAVVASPAGPLGAFYTFFLPSGAHTLRATHGEFYGEGQVQVTVSSGATVGQDLALPAGQLALSPDALQVELEMGEAAQMSLDLANQGRREANFELNVLPYEPYHPGELQAPDFVVKPFKQDFRPTAPPEAPPAPDAPVYPGAQVAAVWDSGIPAAWGVVFDTQEQRVWVSSPGNAWGGDDRLQAFTSEGQVDKGPVTHALPHLYGPADLAFDPWTGKLWVLNVRSKFNNCIYAVDPSTGYTGEEVCPGGKGGFEVSQRGLAFDPRTQTWLAAGWNDGSMYRFNQEGEILERIYTGLPASGLAYNPVSRRAFAMLSADPARILVLDEATGWSVLGQIELPGFSPYGGAGLEMDGQGRLWAVDQMTGRVYLIETGEPAPDGLAAEASWLVPNPSSGKVLPAESQAVQFSVDGGAAGLAQPGVYYARVQVQHDTPYPVPDVPVTVTVKAPASYGLLEGRVTSAGYCGTHPGPIRGANLRIANEVGGEWIVQSGRDGRYQVWLDSTQGAYTVEISLPGYGPGDQSGVQIGAGQTTVLDWNLPFLSPCVTVDPSTLFAQISEDGKADLSLTLANAGEASTRFEITSEGNLPGWLVLPILGGDLPAGGNVTIQVQINAEGLGIFGDHTAVINVDTSDPVVPRIQVPVLLRVGQGFIYHFALIPIGNP